MKQRDLKPCLLCGKGVMHDNNLAFYRVRIQHLFANVPAINRQIGLQMMMGGNAAIAHVMGPDEDMALPVGDEVDALLCQECALVREHPIPRILELAEEKDTENPE